jgi:hypothetical protein
VPYKNVGFIVYVSLTSQGSRPQFQGTPTLATGDVTLSVDGAASGNLGTLPTVTPASGKRVKATVAATENTGTNAEIIFSDVSGSEWDDLAITWENERRTMDSGVATAGAASTVTLPSTASATDNLYVGSRVEIIGGTGAGQSRVVTGYVGSTKVVTVDRAWVTNPSSDSVYLIWPDETAQLDSSLRTILQPTQTGVTIPTVTTTGTATTVTNGVTLANGAVSATAIADNAITAAKIATDAIDSDAVKADLLTDIQQLILSDVTPFAGSNINATISSRSTLAAGAQMDLVAAPNATALIAVGVAVWASASRSLTSFGTLVADIWANTSRTLSATGVQAIWDALSSALTTPGSIGKRIVDYLDAKISLVGGSAGAGAITWVYTLTSSVTGDPIGQADVWVTTDSAGSNVIASGTTSDLGTVTFYLDAGTYYFWRSKSGWNFSNPDTEVVS